MKAKTKEVDHTDQVFDLTPFSPEVCGAFFSKMPKPPTGIFGQEVSAIKAYLAMLESPKNWPFLVLFMQEWPILGL